MNCAETSLHSLPLDWGLGQRYAPARGIFYEARRFAWFWCIVLCLLPGPLPCLAQQYTVRNLGTIGNMGGGALRLLWGYRQ